jgi:hypothetical protein
MPTDLRGATFLGEADVGTTLASFDGSASKFLAMPRLRVLLEAS